jgi:hypothetical protein
MEIPLWLSLQSLLHVRRNPWIADRVRNDDINDATGCGSKWAVIPDLIRDP